MLLQLCEGSGQGLYIAKSAQACCNASVINVNSWACRCIVDAGPVAKPALSEGLALEAQHAAQSERSPVVPAAKKSSSDILSMLLGKG